MASKLTLRKLEVQRSGIFWKKTSCSGDVIRIPLLLACSAAAFLLCFVFVDVRAFYGKRYSEEFAVLQRGLGTTSMNFHGSEEGTAYRPLTEIALEADKGEAEVDGSDKEEKNSVSEPLESSTGPDSNDSAVVVEEAHDSGRNDESMRSDTHTSKDDSQYEAKLKLPVGAVTENRERKPLSGCDISKGKWVFDETYPLYRSRNCPFADPGFRCEENGRPDTDFMKYRWQPRDCDLPRYLSTLTTNCYHVQKITLTRK